MSTFESLDGVTIQGSHYFTGSSVCELELQGVPLYLGDGTMNTITEISMTTVMPNHVVIGCASGHALTVCLAPGDSWVFDPVEKEPEHIEDVGRQISVDRLHAKYGIALKDPKADGSARSTK